MKKLGMPPALIYIRKNVTLKRIKEVEKELEDWRMFDQITETVYRAYKGSFKIQHAQPISCELIRLICYLLSGKYLKEYVGDNKKVVKNIEKVFKKNSTFVNLTKRYLSLSTGKRTKSGWILIDECMFPLMGGELFYYCILKSILKVARQALKDKKYSYEVMNWDEAICEYVIVDVKKEEYNCSWVGRKHKEDDNEEKTQNCSR